jgi:rsbT co-antagonist protein RsbR
MEERSEILQETIDCMPDIVYAKDGDLRYVVANKTGCGLLGIEPAQIIGKRMHEVFAKEAAEMLDANDRRICAERKPMSLEEPIPIEGLGLRIFLTTKTPFYNEDGSPRFLAGVSQDITDRKRSEEALQKSREELSETRTNLLATIRELSTPVLPIRDGVLVVPLVGHMDSQRSAQLTDAILTNIQRHRADTVIIDITGVEIVDTAVANHLIQATRSAALLGAECVLVGIAPGIAQTLVQIGVDFSSIITRRDLQAGVAYAVEKAGEEGLDWA